MTRVRSLVSKINAGDQRLPEITGQAWKALEQANQAPHLFRFGRDPVRIHDDKNGMQIHRLTVDRMRNEMARSARWFRIEKKKEVPAKPPLDVVRNVLAQASIPLPILNGITRCPIYAPTGEIQIARGYHTSTGFYHAPGAFKFKRTVSDNPDTADLERAKKLITKEWLGDFPFVGPADRANVVAMIVQPIIRSLIPGPTPLHLINKPAPGTGASLLVDSLSIVPTGLKAQMMTAPRSEEEFRRTLVAKLQSAPTLVVIDNVEKLNSSALSSAITSTYLEDRRIQSSETLVVPVQTSWIATGNNPEVSNEIARRTVPIRLDAHHPQPWRRKADQFRHPKFLQWVKHERELLLWALLVLVRAWDCAGRPGPDAPSIGGFESYCEVTGGILRHAGIEGFLSNLDDFYGRSDTETVVWCAFVAAWAEKHGETEVGVADLWTLVIDQQIPLKLGDGGDRSQTTKLGSMLRGMRDRQFGEFRIVAGRKVKNAQLWRLERVNLGEPSTDRLTVVK